MRKQYAWGLVLLLFLAVFAMAGSADNSPPGEQPTINFLLNDEVNTLNADLGAPIAGVPVAIPAAAFLSQNQMIEDKSYTASRITNPHVRVDVIDYHSRATASFQLRC